jgi:hypothetical protein
METIAFINYHVHNSLYSEPDESKLYYPVYLKIVLIASFHINLVVQVIYFLQGFPSHNLLFCSNVRHACARSPFWFDHLNMWWWVKLQILKLRLCIMHYAAGKIYEKCGWWIYTLQVLYKKKSEALFFRFINDSMNNSKVIFWEQ